jgi:hypothetical protein
VGTFVLAAAAAAVVVSAVLIASCLRLPSPIGFLLAVFVLASAEIVSVSLLLSIGHWLTRVGLVVAVAVVLCGALASWLGLGRPPPPPLAAATSALREALRDPIIVLLAALTAASQAYLLAVSLTVPQSLPDTMLYHLPRAALWRQHHAVAYVANVPELAVNVFPPNAEIETSTTMILSGGDRYVGLVQLAALAFACVAIAGVAQRLGFDRRAAVFAALAFSTFTVVMLQTPTALNDLVVASLLAACAYFALGSTRVEFVLGALALALAFSTKLTSAFALPALALVVLSTQPRRRWAVLALSGAAGLAAGSFWLLVNLYETGRFDGGVAVDSAGQGLGYRVLWSFLDLLEMSDGEGTGLLTSPLWGVPILAVALVAAAVLCWRRRWVAGALTALVGVFAFVSLPLLITWVQVGGNALRHARAALGLGGGGSGPRLPEDFYESPMHSSYGLAFIVLFLGSCALVTADLVRRQGSRGSAAALIGVPLTLVLAAVAIGFDPQHLRYWAFPVALATSVFGIALRVRALAWTAGVLAVGTVVVSLAYFVPRPGGLVLLSENRGSDQTARWFVQGGGGDGDPVAFRYLEQSIPPDATLALAVETNTYLYPAWDARLRRRVLFTTPDGGVPASAGWLVVGPAKRFEPEARSWTRVLESPRGWRIYRRS